MTPDGNASKNAAAGRTRRWSIIGITAAYLLILVGGVGINGIVEARAQQEGRVVNVSAELPKSFIVTDFPIDTVYVSQLSTAALKGRAEHFSVK